MKKKHIGDCADCGWGIEWSGEPGNMQGRCRWECPVPHPNCLIMVDIFAEGSKPKENCPTWKKITDPLKYLMRRKWAEPWEEYLKRLNVERERIISEHEKKRASHADP